MTSHGDHKFALIAWGLDECGICGRSWFDRVHSMTPHGDQEKSR